jgi:hypothetical protein
MKKVIYLTALRNMAGITAYEGKRGGTEKVHLQTNIDNETYSTVPLVHTPFSYREEQNVQCFSNTLILQVFLNSIATVLFDRGLEN